MTGRSGGLVAHMYLHTECASSRLELRRAEMARQLGKRRSALGCHRRTKVWSPPPLYSRARTCDSIECSRALRPAGLGVGVPTRPLCQKLVYFFDIAIALVVSYSSDNSC